MNILNIKNIIHLKIFIVLNRERNIDICTVSNVRLFETPMDCSPPGFFVDGDSPSKNTGVGCHAFFQRIFPTQGWSPGFLNCRQILYCLNYQGSLRILEWVAYPFSRGRS